VPTDPFMGPEPDSARSRPTINAGYEGECGVCGIEFDEGDEIRATADGAGWEAVDHDHDPEESAAVLPVEVGRLPLPSFPEGLYGDSPPDDRVAEPAQFSCPECPKQFAVTKDRLVRTHKLNGVRCPGSRSVPLELVDAAVADPGEPGPLGREAVRTLTDAVPPGTPHVFSTDPEAVAVLDRAAAMSPTVAAMRERLAGGQADRIPVAAPPEDAPDAAHDDYEKQPGTAFPLPELAPEGVTPVPEPLRANPDVDRVALYAHRPAEPEPTAENGGREPLYGRYVLPNPKTGKGKTWRRATTFASQLDDTYNLDAWQKRHLVRGAALAVARDSGMLLPYAQMDVRADKSVLNDLAEALMTESGVHAAAEQGTYVHTLTETVDRAPTAEQEADAWEQVPHHYRADVAAYRNALETYGLRVVPALLERRTAVVEYGVAGTFDQVTEVVELQDWSRRLDLSVGDFLVTDKKTGSDMSYGTGTHGIQLWLYAHGINTSGVWDAFTGQWTRPVTVREDVGVIVHIPLEQGKCTLHSLNLTRGREGAVLVQQGYDRAKMVRSQALRFSQPIGTVTVPKTPPPPSVPVPVEAPVSQPVPAAPAVNPMQVWIDRVAAVADQQQAYAVYQAAADAGMPDGLRKQLQDALTARLAAVAAPALVAVAHGTSPEWDGWARRVATREQAGELFIRAQNAPGMTAERLRDLTAVMQSAIAGQPPF